ncbi:MAG: nuclear transport factor 2 family protein [Nitrososphaera sp.]|uniref:nuclear transport factor 2 family protein n=1 Tax=Nitrososphaera sp. TaxID=1971748 RepID=UPI0017B44F85|nr:nuclear transport factor 2 family protein [Nitrososphaera sp.]NWG38055.1 nuclear transport factor 2 family protein [Nitrososphaera sp.]
MLTGQETVRRYFDLITKKDADGILDLFTDDEPVVYEPFSNEKEGLRGKEAIESFLKIVLMANAGLKRDIRFEDGSDDETTALVTFERGTTLRGRFTFNFVKEAGEGKKGDGHVRRIKSLRIKFL